MKNQNNLDIVAGLGIAFLGHTTHADAAENNNQQQSTYNYSTTDVSFSKSGNLYTSGQCTWYVYDKLVEKSDQHGECKISSSSSRIHCTPEEGAIMQSSEGAFGHVALKVSIMMVQLLYQK